MINLQQEISNTSSPKKRDGKVFRKKSFLKSAAK